MPERIEDLSADDLEAAIREHDTHYWTENDPQIPDEEYDRLVERLRQLDPSREVLHLVGADPVGTKVTHDRPMLSLQKAYTVGEVADWLLSTQVSVTLDRALGVVVSNKVDGLACSLRYDDRGRLSLAATRGNGEVGDDVTTNARRIKTIPKGFLPNAEVRGEVYMRLSTFKKYAADYANPRNLAAGALKQSDADASAEYELSFLAYDLIRGGATPTAFSDSREILRAGGFEVVNGIKGNYQVLEQMLVAMKETVGLIDYEVDGLVIRLDRNDCYDELGATSHHPRGAIALKYQGDSVDTTFDRVEWEVSRGGTLNPVAVVDPVHLSGAVVTRASLHNLAFIEELGGVDLVPGLNRGFSLSRGATVQVTRRGGVIPHIECVVTPCDGHIIVPETCRVCSGAAKRINDFLHADHASTCSGAGVGRLDHFVKVVDIQGFGPVIIQQLWDADLVREPADFYTLNWQDLVPLDRFAERKARRLVGEVKEHTRIRLRDFLRSLSIHELGNKVSRDLEAHYGDLESIRNAGIDELLELPNIGPAIAGSVVTGLKASAGIINNLLCVVDIYVKEAPVSESNALEGKSFLFTGAMEAMKRADGVGLVLNHGGVSASSVTAKLDFLVLGDKDFPRYQGGWRSTKLKKAEKLIADGAALRVISEAEFRRLAAP